MLRFPVCQNLPTQPIISFVVKYFLCQGGDLGSSFLRPFVRVKFFFLGVFLCVGLVGFAIGRMAPVFYLLLFPSQSSFPPWEVLSVSLLKRGYGALFVGEFEKVLVFVISYTLYLLLSMCLKLVFHCYYFYC